MKTDLPLSLRILKFICWVQAFAYIAFIAAFLFILQNFEVGGALDGFKTGLLQSAGIRAIDFTPYIAGKISGHNFVFAAFPILTLVLLNQRRSLGLKCLLGLGALIALSQGTLAFVIAGLKLSTILLGSSRAYLESGSK